MFNYLWEILFTSITSLIGFLIFRNNKLKKNNDQLSQLSDSKERQLKIYKEIVHVNKTTKDESIDGNIKRMRDQDL